MHAATYKITAELQHIGHINILDNFSANFCARINCSAWRHVMEYGTRFDNSAGCWARLTSQFSSCFLASETISVWEHQVKTSIHWCVGESIVQFDGPAFLKLHSHTLLYLYTKLFDMFLCYLTWVKLVSVQVIGDLLQYPNSMSIDIMEGGGKSPPPIGLLQVKVSSI